VWDGYGVCSNLASSGEPPPLLLHKTTLTTDGRASDSPMFWTSVPAPLDEPYRLRQTIYTLFTFSTHTDEQTDRYCLGKMRVTYDNECS